MAPNNDKAPKLLAGGNPQIPKGDGDEPVRAYIEAMPDWKRRIGEHIDDLVVANVDDLHKAVRWNSPFYKVGEDGGYFLSFHCFTKYVKFTFFDGADLNPPPPESGKDAKVRYLHLSEDDEVDDEQIIAWIQQAATLPGWRP